MLISEKLILVELHKAGSARVKKVLGDVLGGESIKGEKKATELLELGKPVVGYLCNPLTWYLAQWRQGCLGKGDLYKRLTNDSKWSQMKARRAGKAAKENEGPTSSEESRASEGAKSNAKMIPDEWDAEYARTEWYADGEDALAFHEWLRAMLSVPGMRRLIDNGFGRSALARQGGLMTYQFFNSFVRDAQELEKPALKTIGGLQAAYEAGKITSYFVRSESIDTDLRSTLQSLGVALEREQGNSINALKAGALADDAALLRFYDTPSLRLVAKREAFINELFGYEPPSAEARAAARLAERKAGKTRGQGKPAGGKPNKSGNAAKEGKAGKPGKPGKAGKLGKAKAASAGGEQQKLKRVKNKPAGDDVIDADE